MFLSERPVSFGKKPRQSRIARLFEDEEFDFPVESIPEFKANHQYSEEKLAEIEATNQRQQAMANHALKNQVVVTPGRSIWDY